ncbi:MAG: PocR ligand-binding domain-containing protein, partial [Candidatus Omnitrophica bacterium]|nr:PocR ligand-binding domain-containing protein [Candidatus Omnitrophota bacterium]
HHGMVYHCPHRLSYFLIPIRCEDETIGTLMVGPILLGKREDQKTHDNLAKTLGVDHEVFSDRIREIKVFSHHGIRIVLEFLEELVHHLVREAYHRQELEKLVPGFLAMHQLGDKFFSATHSNLLVNYLLDIASEVVGADSGSVLLIDETKKTFSIKSARGLHREVIKTKYIPLTSSITGWVVAKRKPVLIGLSGTKEEVPHERLKRPKIKVSMVVPLEVGPKVLGVFCLNSKSANRRFNRNNLALLDQLGKLAGVALAKSSVN